MHRILTRRYQSSVDAVEEMKRDEMKDFNQLMSKDQFDDQVFVQFDYLRKSVMKSVYAVNGFEADAILEELRKSTPDEQLLFPYFDLK